MNVNFSWHPLALNRVATLFCREVVIDLDLRFPETRKRRALELTLSAPIDSPLKTEFSFENFVTGSDRFSVFDWPLLFELNERWQQNRLQILVHLATNDPQVRASSSTSRVIRAILSRLTEIESLMRNDRLPEQPPLWSLIKFRWKFASIRDEVGYLLERLDVHRKY